MGSIHLCIVIVIVLFLVVVWHQQWLFSKAISGFWEADAEFCEMAGIGNFCIYLGDADIYGNRGCTLLMTRTSSQDDIEYILLDPTVAKFSQSLCNPMSTVQHYTVKFGLDDDDVLPHKVGVKIDILHSKMVIKDSEKVYGILYKSSQMSEMYK